MSYKVDIFILVAAAAALTWIAYGVEAQNTAAALAVCTAKNGVVGAYPNPQDTMCKQ